MITTAAASTIVTVSALWLAYARLPVCKPSAERWSCREVRTCGGLVFLPIYAVLTLLLGDHSLKAMSLVLTSFLIWWIGWIDDNYGLKAHEKLIIQLPIALCLIYGGWVLKLTGILYADYWITLFWIAGITNAFNMIDNMDGLSAGIAAIVFFFLSAATGNIVTAVMFGIAAGFLILNYPPACIFMGDCGSLFLGLNAACLSTELNPPWSATILLAVPILDVCFVSIRRMKNGRSPLTGGTDHISHELARMIGTRKSMFLLWLGSIGLGLIVLYPF